MLFQDLNPKLKSLKPSATLLINELSKEMISKGFEIYKLGFGQSPFPVPDKIINALKENAYQKDYLPVKGLLELRKNISHFFNDNYKLSTTENDILIGPGSKELIYNFQLVYNIDELLLPSPSWVSYEPQAKLNNRKTVWLQTFEKNDWKIKPLDIIEYCKNSKAKQRVIIFNYPSNPLGITYSNDELKALAKVFKKFKIIVVADEIYGEVHFEGKHQTIANYYPEGTIISTGLSKWAGAGGWRLGIFVFPKNLNHILEAMAIVASETFTSTSAPIQYAAIEAYKIDKPIKLYLANSRKILKGVGIYTYENLINIGVRMPKPEGGFYLFPNFEKWRVILNKRKIETSTQLCNTLLKETGVALLPGVAFGFPETSLTARLSFVDFDGKNLLKILEEKPNQAIDKEFIETHCQKIVIAIEKIKKWLN